MASVSLFNLSAGTVSASGDFLVYCDISDTTQSANGSDVKITFTNFFAGIVVPVNVTSASATAFAVGRLGATTPAFTVDASTASQVAGLKVTGAATAGTVALVVTDSGADANLTINAKGTGTIGIGTVSTGRVTITPVTTITGSLTLSAALIYGGVTLSNAVTGTGNMVLSASPTLTGTITAVTANFSGLVTANAGIVIAASQALTGTVANSTISGFLSVAATTGTFTNVGGTVTTITQNSVTTMTGLVSVGALNAGSITSGFGSIDVGADAISGGALTATTGTFTSTLAVTGAATFSAVNLALDLSGASTSYRIARIKNTGGVNGLQFGVEGSSSGVVFTGSTSYAAVIGSSSAIDFCLGYNGIVALTFTTGGAATFAGTVSTGALTATTGTFTSTLAVTGAASNAIGNTASSTTNLILAASVAGVSSLRAPHGTAPSSPVDGDMWTTTAGLYVRINGGTVGPLS